MTQRGNGSRVPRQPGWSGEDGELMANDAMKPGDLVPGRVTRVHGMLAQVIAREQQGVIYGGAAAQLTVGQHVRVRILEVNGSNGYRFTAALLN